MSDLIPKKVVNDDSPKAKETFDGRKDAYDMLSPEKQRTVDYYVDRRDDAVEKLGDAEKDLSKNIKRCVGKSERIPGSIALPPADDVEFDDE